MKWEGSGAKTLFYQGMYSSQTQLAKYTGKTRGFIATTGEHVICANGMEAILDPHIGIELQEVILCNKNKWNDPLQRCSTYLLALQIITMDSRLPEVI